MDLEKINEIAERMARDAKKGNELNGSDALLAVAHLLADETHGNYSASTLLERAGLLKGWRCWMRLERTKEGGE